MRSCIMCKKNRTGQYYKRFVNTVDLDCEPDVGYMDHYSMRCKLILGFVFVYQLCGD